MADQLCDPGDVSSTGNINCAAGRLRGTRLPGVIFFRLTTSSIFPFLLVSPSAFFALGNLTGSIAALIWALLLLRPYPCPFIQMF